MWPTAITNLYAEHKCPASGYFTMATFTLLHRYSDIEQLARQVDVEAYARTRNYVQGSVSYLSPYLSRGVLTLPYVKQLVLQRYTTQQAYTFLFELAWREYFQRQWYRLGDDIWKDIKQPQQGVQHYQMPVALVNAATGIEAVDNAIIQLYTTGYMHNHVRMYTAAIACNTGAAHWLQPARWLYYHLADHDIACNTLSWQWVAGTFSSKRYYCDQQNINKYTGTEQRGTFLDVPYEKLGHIPVPQVLKGTTLLNLHTPLPHTPVPVLDPALPVLLYNSYNLDPAWRSTQPANRILLLEPGHFERYPVSEKVLQFILALAGNIPGIQVYCGELSNLPLHTVPAVYSKQHPAFTHYPGVKDEPEWMYPQLSRTGGSFMAYWKECCKYLEGV